MIEKCTRQSLTRVRRKYKDGGVGSLTHGITLHGTAYSTNLEVFADGYQLRLVDLYNKPSLHVR